jgi:hypothetical protein
MEKMLTRKYFMPKQRQPYCKNILIMMALYTIEEATSQFIEQAGTP